MSKDKSRQINAPLRKSPFIEVGIGEFKYQLPTNDSKRKEIMRKIQDMQQRQADLMDRADKVDTSKGYEETIKIYDEVNDVVKEAIDLVLGSGTFDELYEATGEDLEAVLEAFIEVMGQYNSIQEKSKLSKLVEAKKKKG